MGSTLGDDQTHTALVGGYEIKFKNSETTLKALDGLEAQVDTLNANKGWQISLFVPGDTVYAGEEFYGSVILGRPFLYLSAYDPPTSFDPSTFAKRFEKIEKVTDEEKQFLMQTEGIEITEIDDAKIHLICGGPLCYGAVHVGVAMNEADRDNAKYKYASNQDMSQEWGPDGIDGLNVMNVEFSDVVEFDDSPVKIAEHLAKVPNLENPQFFLLCRYD